MIGYFEYTRVRWIGILLGGLAASCNVWAEMPDCKGQYIQGAPTHESLLRDGWSDVHNSDGIRVYNRKQPDSQVYEVLARGTVGASPRAVFDVVTDYEHYREFMPYTVESRIDGNSKSDRWIWVYERLDFPVVNDRHFVVKVDTQTCRDLNNFYGVVWDQDNGHPLPQNTIGILPKVNSGYWALWPINEGHETDAIYYLHSDPGGLLPSFLVNMANRTALPLVIEKVRERSKR